MYVSTYNKRCLQLLNWHFDKQRLENIFLVFPLVIFKPNRSPYLLSWNLFKSWKLYRRTSQVWNLEFILQTQESFMRNFQVAVVVNICVYCTIKTKLAEKYVTTSCIHYSFVLYSHFQRLDLDLRDWRNVLKVTHSIEQHDLLAWERK